MGGTSIRDPFDDIGAIGTRLNGSVAIGIISIPGGIVELREEGVSVAKLH